MATLIQWEGISLDDYKYPPWAEFIGWVVALASMLLVPGYAIFEVFNSSGFTLREVIKLIFYIIY